LLFGDLRETRQKFSIRPGQCRCVSDGVDVIKPDDTKVVVDGYSTACDTGYSEP
jgi:hypothetical protein